MDEIFFRVFKNKILCDLIFSKVYHIHRDILLLKEKRIFQWDELLDNINLLSYHNYLNEIKEQNYLAPKYSFSRHMVNICQGNSLDVLQYFVNQQPEFFELKNQREKDLLFYSVEYNSLKIFKYLDSLSTSNNQNNNNDNYDNNNKRITPSTTATTSKVEWDYYHAISIVPSTGNIEIFLYLLDKIDIRGTLINKINSKKQYSNLIETIESSAENGRSEMLDHIFSFFKSDNHLLDEILIKHIASITRRIIRKCGQLYILKQYFNNIIIQDKLEYIDLISECTVYNRFEMMKYFHENQLGSKYCNYKYAIGIASLDGYLNILKWLLNNQSEECTTQEMHGAVKNERNEIFIDLKNNRLQKCTTFTHLIDYAASNGHLKTVKWLHCNRTEGCTTNAMDYAASNGHLKTVRWLHRNRTEGCTTDAMNFAAGNGHLEMVRWLHHIRTEGCTTYAMDIASKYKLYDIIKWLHYNRTEGCTTDAMDYTIRKGNLKMVQWFHHNRTEGCTGHSVMEAAINDNYKLLEWLRRNRTDVYPEIMHERTFYRGIKYSGICIIED